VTRILRPPVKAPEAGLKPMPVAAVRKIKAEALEAGALDTRRAWRRLRQNRKMEIQAKAKEISFKPFTHSSVITWLMDLFYPVALLSPEHKGISPCFYFFKYEY
jgi:hypothetical protein